MGQLRFFLVILAAALAAFAVWTWLPPTDETQEAIRQSIAAYEEADRIVYFDVVRRTLRGELLVKAAVDHEPRGGDWRQIFQYRLREQGEGWAVLDVEEESGPNGGPPYYYDPATGEFTQDPGA